MINIGFDAKWYFQGPPSGQVVIRNIIDILVNRELSFMLYLFVEDKYASQAYALERDRVKVILIYARPNLFSNIFIIPFWIKKLKLDLVVFQNFACWWPFSVKKIVCIFDVLFQDFPDFFSKKELLYFSPMRFLAQRADCIITISECEKLRLIKHKYGTFSKINILYLGINKKFKPLTEYPSQLIANVEAKYNLPERYILYVGRINIRKNLLNLVKALPLMEDKSIPLVIVGAANHKNIDITPFLQENNLQERVRLTGHVPDNELYCIYARSTLFCFPSFAEGFGFPPLEAMSCGIPTIVSDRTSLPEICGDAATYINPDKPDDIAKKLDLLLKNSAYYTDKSRLSLLRSAEFTWEKTVDKLVMQIETMTNI